MRGMLFAGMTLGAVFVATTAMAEPLDNEACYARIAAATHLVASTAPERPALGRQMIDLIHIMDPDDLSMDDMLARKATRRQAMDAVMDQVQSGAMTAEQVFADVNGCQTRLGMTVITLAAAP